MIINHNISAMFAARANGKVDGMLTKDIEKLASGLRINHASDDAAGLAVSEKMRAQVRGLQQASRNAADGISFIQTAEGYLEETQDVLQRVRELAIQSANGIYTDEDRVMIQVEFSQMVDEIDRIASHAQFNGLNLLDGRFARDQVAADQAATIQTAGGISPFPTDGITFHIGANMDQYEQVFIGDMAAGALGLRDQVSETVDDITEPNLGNAGARTIQNANDSIGILDEALNTVSKQRADLGAFQNRLELAINGIDVGAENLQAAESRIRDANIAEVVVDFTKNQILLQSSTAMLAQANVKSQSVLQLLG